MAEQLLPYRVLDAMTQVIESTVESAAFAWLSELSWQVKHGAEIAPGEPLAERAAYGQVILEQRLRDALLLKLMRGEIRVNDAERFSKERGL